MMQISTTICHVCFRLEGNDAMLLQAYNPGDGARVDQELDAGVDLVVSSDTQGDDSYECPACDGDAEYLLLRLLPLSLISSIIFATTAIPGRSRGSSATQSSATCRSATISSSAPLPRCSSTSNTSGAHSPPACAAARAHRGRSPAPPSSGECCRPVRISSRTTPKPCTSCLCRGRDSPAGAGARRWRSAKSETRAVPAPSTRMFEEVR
ncbi:unnamed protein product [Urochloa humidicola]